jgi:hypothetical protein
VELVLILQPVVQQLVAEREHGGVRSKARRQTEVERDLGDLGGRGDDPRGNLESELAIRSATRVVMSR